AVEPRYLGQFGFRSTPVHRRSVVDEQDLTIKEETELGVLARPRGETTRCVSERKTGDLFDRQLDACVRLPRRPQQPVEDRPRPRGRTRDAAEQLHLNELSS